MDVERKAISEYSAEEKRALLARLLEKKARTPKKAPLSLAQERLWFLDQLTPGNAAYNMFTAVRLKGDFDVTALEKSFNEIIRRHEVLRTSFQSTDGAPEQIIAPAVTLTLPFVDLSHLPEAEREIEVQRRAEDEGHRPFVLAEAPLLRASVLRLGDQEHVVLVTMHHIVSDGWSLNIFTREMSILYEAFRMGQASPLPELPFQYSDFAQWQRQLLRGELLESRLSYWKDKLEGIPLLLDLPTDHPRPLMQSFRGASRGFRISKDLWAALKELNRREGVTMFMTLLSAFQTLLHRYTSQDDIVIGTPMAGRERFETQSLIGFFLNTLVIRARFADGLTFREVLRQTRETVLEAHENQDLPFEKLVEALSPKRSLSYEPIVQVAFVFVVTQEVHGGEVSALKVEGLSTRNDTTKYDVTLYVQEIADEYVLDIQYSSDLFDDATIARMLRHYEVILREIAVNPEQQVSKVRLLLDSEREQLLTEWNDTFRAYPSDTCLHELFQQQAARTPNAQALICGGDQLTYEELNRRANRLAHRLRALGVGPEYVVGVFMERCVEMVVALLGVLKSGGAYLPLEPSYPRERLELMLEDARPAVLLTQPHLRELLPAVETQLLELGAGWGESGDGVDEAAENIAPGVLPDNAAYVIYTSGSTGRPKGVMVKHGGLSNYLGHAAASYLKEAIEGSVVSSPLTFDATLTTLLAPLLAGRSVELLANDERLMAQLAERLFAAAGNKLFKLTPAHLEALQYVERPQAVGHAAHVLVLGGEQLSATLLRRWKRELLPEASFVNEYGPTEAVVGCSVWWLPEETELEQLAGLTAAPIGRAIANTQIYLLDKQMGPVPIGVAGELHIGGVGLARGYLGRPELTAEKFIPDPFSAAEGSRLYRTGDLARYLADGNIEFLGRLDHQIKLRGFRIELGEIEAVARTHEAVAESVVTLTAPKPADSEVDGELDHRLICYVVPDAVSARGVRRRLRMEREGLLKKNPHLELPNGMLVFGRNRQEAGFMYDEIFASRGYMRHGIELPEGACVFDVGANIGLFTLFIATECPGARIYSFEPIPELYELLRLNAELYATGSHIFDYGLGASEQEVTFTYFPNVSIISGRHADLEQEQEIVRHFVRQQPGVTTGFDEAEIAETLRQRLESRQVAARVRPLGDVIRELGVEQIDLLKIDVEKSEEEVLAGLGDDDWRRIRQVVMEVHDEGGRVARVCADLRERGYDVVVEQDHALQGTGLYNLYAQRTSASPKLMDQSRNGTRKLWLSPRQITEDLEAYFRRQLPEFMVPSDIVLLDEMPLTSSGKVNRRALPAPDAEDARRAASYVAPRNAIESQLVRMWEDLLPKRPIGVTESFFKLGGHSLLAVRLMARIKKELGQDLPVSTLFAGETVEQLARIVGEQSYTWRWASLVPIQPRGSKPPFYCVHALGGNVNNYYLLAKYMGDDQPFYGLQAPPLHDVTEEDSQIELMAARYVKAIREVQPLGPYRLGGYSFGVFVAYEMARQFRELGQEVALLALFDAYSPIYLNKVPEARDTADMLVSLAWVTSRERGKRLLLPVDILRQLNFDEQLAFFLEKMRAEDLAPPEVDHELLRRFLQGSAARQRAARNYVPQKYPGSITIFRCEERDPLWVEKLSAAGLSEDDQTLGWGELSTEPATVIEIPGHHDVICLEPFVQTLAQRLTECLAASAEQKSFASAMS